MGNLIHSNLRNYFENLVQHILLCHVLGDDDVEGILLVLPGRLELFEHFEEEAHSFQILSMPRRKPFLLTLLCHLKCDEYNVGA